MSGYIVLDILKFLLSLVPKLVQAQMVLIFGMVVILIVVRLAGILVYNSLVNFFRLIAALFQYATTASKPSSLDDFNNNMREELDAQDRDVAEHIRVHQLYMEEMEQGDIAISVYDSYTEMLHERSQSRWKAPGLDATPTGTRAIKPTPTSGQSTPSLRSLGNDKHGSSNGYSGHADAAETPVTFGWQGVIIFTLLAYIILPKLSRHLSFGMLSSQRLCTLLKENFTAVFLVATALVTTTAAMLFGFFAIVVPLAFGSLFVMCRDMTVWERILSQQLPSDDTTPEVPLSSPSSTARPYLAPPGGRHLLPTSMQAYIAKEAREHPEQVCGRPAKECIAVVSQLYCLHDQIDCERNGHLADQNATKKVYAKQERAMRGAQRSLEKEVKGLAAQKAQLEIDLAGLREAHEQAVAEHQTSQLLLQMDFEDLGKETELLRQSVGPGAIRAVGSLKKRLAEAELTGERHEAEVEELRRSNAAEVEKLEGQLSRLYRAYLRAEEETRDMGLVQGQLRESQERARRFLVVGVNAEKRRLASQVNHLEFKKMCQGTLEISVERLKRVTELEATIRELRAELGVETMAYSDTKQ
ncbi:hypothetical protein S40285_04387 [Stachybotrys chlorohalonatus IBT 40285]|uniref:Uncharacterized protein n=1 Tax=Stachybotrys chlorohalonatus (strain IBT 40285) TaxID=1283841 RepID=A0A084QG69_STAC4|nr:hypothetical protein S40285_04387 [Stachybotrys chlorohalonata IBT 40285]